MNQTSASLVFFELDLTFNPASEELWKDLDDQTICVLTSPISWEKDLFHWIDFLRTNDSFFCPMALKATNSLSLGLSFTDDSSIAALNSSWRQVSGPTDVLSFGVFDESLIMPSNQSVELGDVVVSVTTAIRQAAEQKHSLIHELRWLVTHGLLHLLGWDHPDPSSLEEMLNCQEHLLSLVGNL